MTKVVALPFLLKSISQYYYYFLFEMGILVAAWVWVCVAGGRWAASECVDAAGDTVQRVQGDAALTLLLPLHHGPQCDQLDLTAVQLLEATQLAVQKTNELGLIPGVQLGLRVADTCATVQLSVKMAVSAWVEDALSCPQPVFSLGYLGPEDVTSALAVSSATQTLGLPVVAYGPRPAAAEGTIDLLTPAPYRSAQAAVQVLIGAGVDAVSVIHTGDPEGRTLAEHFVTAAQYFYICVDTVLEKNYIADVPADLQAGPGTIVLLGTRHKVQNLAHSLGYAEGPADLLLLVETGGPVPQVELAGLETPTLILQRTAPVLPEFQAFLERDLDAEDSPRRNYLATVSECETCSGSYFGYHAAAPAVIAAVLVYVDALRKAQLTHCGNKEGLCPNISNLEASVWRELLTTASLQEVAAAAFPELLEADLDPGNEDFPRYSVHLLMDGNLTQIGQADQSSAVLGLLEVPEARCGGKCPCSISTPPPPLAPTVSSGFDIMSGAEWWNWEMPDPNTLTIKELAVYATAFTFLVIVLLCSGLVCAFNITKAPPRR